MSAHRRYGGASAPAYAAMLALVGLGYLLHGSTDGRSLGAALALGGLVAVLDCAIYFRRADVRAPKRAHETMRPLTAIAGMVAGAAFVIIGVLAAARVIELG